MTICKQCGVELEDGMKVCPLCESSVTDGRETKMFSNRDPVDEDHDPALLKHILWQIVCVLLLSGIVATLVINLSIAGHLTWSMYPVTVCLIILSYASLMALWRVRLLFQILTGWIVSSALLVGTGSYTEETWPVHLALPILAAVNVICLLIISIISKVSIKGLNILAIMFVGVAVLCLIIEGIISQYFLNRIVLSWSVIVAACLLPVTAAIVFMYFRTRNNSSLQKIFHT
jgi:hypothetical protein